MHFKKSLTRARSRRAVAASAPPRGRAQPASSAAGSAPSRAQSGLWSRAASLLRSFLTCARPSSTRTPPSLGAETSARARTRVHTCLHSSSAWRIIAHMVETEFNGNKINRVDYRHGAWPRLAEFFFLKRLQDLNNFNDPMTRFRKPTISNFPDWLLDHIPASVVCSV